MTIHRNGKVFRGNKIFSKVVFVESGIEIRFLSFGGKLEFHSTPFVNRKCIQIRQFGVSEMVDNDFKLIFL